MTRHAPTTPPSLRSARNTATRPYLRAADRRRQLLAAAGALAGRDGLASLSMVGIAAEAGVSRQLVYEHFPDLLGLVQALLTDRFGELQKALEDARREAPAGIDAAMIAARLVIDTTSEDRHMLRTLLASAGSAHHELGELAAALQTELIDNWTGLFGLERDPGARAVTWAVINAVLGIGDLVDDATVTTAEALAELASLIEAAVTHHRSTPAQSGSGTGPRTPRTS
jgi:AcrR family transcriptional regulator